MASRLKTPWLKKECEKIVGLSMKSFVDQEDGVFVKRRDVHVQLIRFLEVERSYAIAQVSDGSHEIITVMTEGCLGELRKQRAFEKVQTLQGCVLAIRDFEFVYDLVGPDDVLGKNCLFRLDDEPHGKKPNLFLRLDCALIVTDSLLSDYHRSSLRMDDKIVECLRYLDIMPVQFSEKVRQLSSGEEPVWNPVTDFEDQAGKPWWDIQPPTPVKNRMISPTHASTPESQNSCGFWDDQYDNVPDLGKETGNANEASLSQHEKGEEKERNDEEKVDEMEAQAETNATALLGLCGKVSHRGSLWQGDGFDYELQEGGPVPDTCQVCGYWNGALKKPASTRTNHADESSSTASSSSSSAPLPLLCGICERMKDIVDGYEDLPKTGVWKGTCGTERAVLRLTMQYLCSERQDEQGTRILGFFSGTKEIEREELEGNKVGETKIVVEGIIVYREPKKEVLMELEYPTQSRIALEVATTRLQVDRDRNEMFKCQLKEREYKSKLTEKILKKANKEKAKMKSNQDKMQQENVSLKSKIQTMKTKMEKLESQVSDLKNIDAELKRVKYLYEKRQNENQDLMDDIDDLQTQLENSQEKNARLQKEHDALMLKHSALLGASTHATSTPTTSSSSRSPSAGKRTTSPEAPSATVVTITNKRTTCEKDMSNRPSKRPVIIAQPQNQPSKPSAVDHKASVHKLEKQTFDQLASKPQLDSTDWLMAYWAKRRS